MLFILIVEIDLILKGIKTHELRCTIDVAGSEGWK